MVGQLVHLYTSYMALEGEGWIYPFLWAFSDRPLLFACICLNSIMSIFVVTLALFHTHVIATNMNTNEAQNQYKYSHFWRRVGPAAGQTVSNSQQAVLTDFEFVNPFDEGIMKNCYNFWMGTPLKDLKGLSKVKYIELRPMTDECHLHEH